jgi:hypothetical protein
MNVLVIERVWIGPEFEHAGGTVSMLASKEGEEVEASEAVVGSPLFSALSSLPPGYEEKRQLEEPGPQQRSRLICPVEGDWRIEPLVSERVLLLVIPNFQGKTVIDISGLSTTSTPDL